MLVEFKFSNFRSFKEEAVFSMEPLSQNGSNPNTINTNLKKVPQLYRTAGIFGANASGKSNIMVAFGFLQFLVKQSAKSVVGDKFPSEFMPLQIMHQINPLLLIFNLLLKIIYMNIA